MDLLLGLGKTVVGRIWLGSCVVTLAVGYCVMHIVEAGPKWALPWASPSFLTWAVTLPAAVFVVAHFELMRRTWFGRPIRPGLYGRVVRVCGWVFWGLGVTAMASIFL